MNPVLSVVIPVFKNNSLDFLNSNMLLLKNIPGVEIICVCTSEDNDYLLLKKTYNYAHFFILKTNTRAARLNHGIKNARSNMVLLCHPRSLLNSEGVSSLMLRSGDLIWGGFHHRFDQSTLGLRFTSWYSNEIRSKICSNIYLDHCIFFNKKLFSKEEEEYIPKVSIFEDSLFSYKMKKKSKAVLLNECVVTSSIRFNNNGFCKQVLLNQILKVLFFLGLNEDKLNYFYEKNISLNSSYKRK